MTSTYGTLIAAVLADMTSNVTGFPVAEKQWTSKPFWYPAGDPSVAVFFEGERVEDTGPTGSRIFLETYTLHYWEAAPFEDANMIARDADTEALYVLFEAIRDRLMTKTNETVGASEFTVMSGTQMMAAAEGTDAFVRGFEITFSARRHRAYT